MKKREGGNITDDFVDVTAKVSGTDHIMTLKIALKCYSVPFVLK